MDSKEPNKCSYAGKIKAIGQLKRHNTYNQISVDKREELLLARRTKKQDSVIIVPQKPTTCYKSGCPKQIALTIRSPLPLPERAVCAQPCVDTSRNNLEKGKDICSPFVIHETGGTSNQPRSSLYKSGLPTQTTLTVEEPPPVPEEVSRPMDPEETRKHPRTTKEAYDKNAKRREVYHNMSLAQKDALLLQRRLKKREATTKHLLANTHSANPIEPTYATQNNVDVQCFSSTSQTEHNESEVFMTPNVLQKEKNTVHPFGLYEEGSTSGASAESHAPSFKNVSAVEMDFLANYLLKRFLGTQMMVRSKFLYRGFS